MSTEHLACPSCGNGEFWLLPDGRIICEDEDCHATMGHMASAPAAPREGEQ